MKIFKGATLFFVVLIVFPCTITQTLASTSTDFVFDLSNGSAFIYDASNVTFRNQSAELIPDGVEYDMGKLWDDIGIGASWRVTTDPNGFVYVKGGLGTTPKRLNVTKLDSSLSQVWAYIDDPGDNYVYHDYGRIYFDPVTTNIYTGGGIKDMDTGQWYWYVLALDSDGNKLWDDMEIMPLIVGGKDYNFDTPSYIEYGANAFGTDSQGNLYASGISGNIVSSLSYNSHLRAIKYDSEGNKIWDNSAEQEWTFGTEPDDTNVPKRQISSGGAWDAKVDSDGNVYTTGPGVLLPWPARGEDYVTTKIGSDGSLLWARAWSGAGQRMDRSETVSVDDLGNVYVGGFASITTGKPITLMYDKDGNTGWARNAYNTDSTLESAANGYVLGSDLCYTGDIFIGFGYSAAGGLFVWYDNEGNRKFVLQDFWYPSTTTAGGWNISGREGYLYLTSAEDGGNPATEGIFRYKYTFPQQSQASLTLSDHTQAFAFKHLTSFSEQSSGGGTAKYQISNNGTDWYYFDGNQWSGATDDSAYSNTASVVNDNIADFPNQIGIGNFYFRVYMDSSNFVSLGGITVGYDNNSDSTTSDQPQISILPETGKNGSMTLLQIIINFIIKPVRELF